MRLLLDEMLGRLARWLRLLGHDAAYARDVGDDEVLARARAEGRLLVTRDVELASRAARDPGSVLLAARETPVQLRELRDALGPAFDEAEPLSRCSVCNEPLAPAAAGEVDVPPEVAARHAAFLRCATCGRAYWEGTHVAEIRAALAELRADDRTSDHGPSG